MADSICANSPAFDLTGGSPVGGTYSGPGIASNELTFDPSVAGSGNHILTYVYTDGNTCTDSALHIITVNPLPVVTMDPVAPICLSNPVVTLSGSPAGGTFTGTGVSGNIFDPSVSGAGDFDVSYAYTDTITRCLVTAGQVIKVNSLPAIPLADTSLCGNRVLHFDATVSNASSYLWTPGNQTTPSIQVDTTGKGLGQFTYSVTVTDVNSCISTKSLKVTFFDCTGIEEPNGSFAIELYPNPNTGQFSIRSNSIPSGNYRLRIYNALSSVVYTEDNVRVDTGFQKPLDLKNLPNGMYLLRLENTSNGWSKQFILNR
jgi:hypothetical protein